MEQLIEPNTHRTIDCPYPDEETEVHDYDKSVYVCRDVSSGSAIKHSCRTHDRMGGLDGTVVSNEPLPSCANQSALTGKYPAARLVPLLLQRLALVLRVRVVCHLYNVRKHGVVRVIEGHVMADPGDMSLQTYMDLSSSCTSVYSLG